MSDLEAVGDAATGAVLASTVEPKTGADGHTRENNCLNCGTELAGDYCHACGQRGHVHRTLHAFGHDLDRLVVIQRFEDEGMEVFDVYRRTAGDGGLSGTIGQVVS